MTSRLPRSGDVAIELDGHLVRLTSLDRVMWPRARFRKGDMLEYYWRVAPALLPHIRDRALTMRRLPEGVCGSAWYQAECRGAPPWIRTVEVPSVAKGRIRHCVIDSTAALLWAVNLSSLELHTYLGTVDSFEHPTALLLDLDPGDPAGLAECCDVALLARDALGAAGLRGWVMTTGSLGLHVRVPLDGTQTFADTKRFARVLAADLAAAHPALITDVQARHRRAGRVLVDWLQNDPTRSAVAQFSLRAASLPTVATPVEWSAVERVAASRDWRVLVFLPRDALAAAGTEHTRSVTLPGQRVR
jgi:bifunctional non-homologous end joining protein LigD